MPAFAPAASVKAQLLRGQAAQQAHHSGRVTLGDRVFDTVEVHPGEVRDVPLEDGSGWERVQSLRVVIGKDLLRTAPGKRTTLTHLGIDYLIKSVAASQALEPAWVIRAERRSPVPS